MKLNELKEHFDDRLDRLEKGLIRDSDASWARHRATEVELGELRERTARVEVKAGVAGAIGGLGLAVLAELVKQKLGIGK